MGICYSFWVRVDLFRDSFVLGDCEEMTMTFFGLCDWTSVTCMVSILFKIFNRLKSSEVSSNLYCLHVVFADL